jgi:hypothetical protein
LLQSQRQNRFIIAHARSQEHTAFRCGFVGEVNVADGVITPVLDAGTLKRKRLIERKTRRGSELVPIEEVVRNPLLVSKQESCRLLGGISPRTLDYMIVGKEIAVTRIGRRTFVRYASLLAYIRRDHASPSKLATGEQAQRDPTTTALERRGEP